jgi:hypothetical protein
MRHPAQLLVKKIISLLFIAAAIAAFPIQTALGQVNSSLQRQRIQASYMLVFARAPSEAEIAYWLKQGALSMSQLIANNTAYLGKDPGTKRATIIKSYNDAFGRNPSQAEISYWSAGNNSYTQMMKNNIQWLAGNPAQYENVIKTSYQYVFGRQPSAGELAYWKSQGVLSFMVLVASHTDWKARNGTAPQQVSGRPTLSASSPIFSVIRVDPSIANEARLATGLVASGAGNLVASGAGNLVASGAGNLVASGAGNLVASGAGN